MLRPQPHPTHLNFDEALAVVARVKPQRTVFTHLAHEVDHAKTEAKLPAESRLAYDGMVIECP
jgi:phosphoribosyl 1,2-cyclic phosphate phosphodiesterase